MAPQIAAVRGQVENSTSTEPAEGPRGAQGSMLLHMFRSGFLSVCVYRHIKHGMKFYDTVIYRKIKTKEGSKWLRGPNLKPDDLAVLIRLLNDADTFIGNLVKTPYSTP